jgi:hypothetical protein
LRLALFTLALSALAQTPVSQPATDVYSGPKLSPRKDADSTKMRPGDYACAFPIHLSYQGHIWISRESLFYSDRCTFTIQKIKGGWRIWTNKIPLSKSSSDFELQRLGFIRVTEIMDNGGNKL